MLKKHKKYVAEKISFFPSLEVPDNEGEEAKVSVTQRAAFQIRQFQVSGLGQLLAWPTGLAEGLSTGPAGESSQQ